MPSLILIFVYFSLQLRVQAYDSLYPNDRATTIVNITVTRNEYQPQFDEQTYRKTINETVDIGYSVLRVNATDRDLVSSA